jgi:hypothetical protein
MSLRPKRLEHAVQAKRKKIKTTGTEEAEGFELIRKARWSIGVDGKQNVSFRTL